MLVKYPLFQSIAEWVVQCNWYLTVEEANTP